MSPILSKKLSSLTYDYSYSITYRIIRRISGLLGKKMHLGSVFSLFALDMTFTGYSYFSMSLERRWDLDFLKEVIRFSVWFSW